MKLSHAGFVAAALLVSTTCFADPALREVRGPTPPSRAPNEGALARRWAREGSAAAAAALGRAELRLGMATEAAEHLMYALAHVEDTDPAWVDIVHDLVAARRMIVVLRIRASEDGAGVYVDDRYVGDAPLAREIFVDEGRHEIRAVLAGFDSAPISVHGAMGERVDVDVGLTRAPPPAVETARPVQATPADVAPLARTRTWVLAGGSLMTLGALGAGTGYAAAAISGAGNQENMNRSAAIWLTTGGVLLGATLTYALWPAPVSRPQEPARLLVGVAPTSGGSALSFTGVLDP